MDGDNGIIGPPTDFHSIPSKVEPWQDHLPKTKFRTEGREEADRQYTQNIHEENCKAGIDESKVEDGIRQSSNGKGRDDKVGREPL